MTQLIIQAAECVTHQNKTFFIFPHRTNSPSPTDLASSLQQIYLQAALLDNGAQLPRAKSPLALTNVVSTEQETLCSHISVKYLLFISAKAKGGQEKEMQQWRKWNWSQKRGWGRWQQCETFHDNRTGGFGTGLLQYSEKLKSNISEWECAAGWAINLSLSQKWHANNDQKVFCDGEVWVVRWQPSSMKRKENIMFRLMCKWLLI